MKKLFDGVVGLFVMFALYTPLLWFISSTMDRQGAFSFDEVDLSLGEHVTLWALVILPLVAIFKLKDWRTGE